MLSLILAECRIVIGMPSVILLSAAELLLIERRSLKTLNVLSSIYLSS